MAARAGQQQQQCTLQVNFTLDVKLPAHFVVSRQQIHVNKVTVTTTVTTSQRN
jgi:hypothetical protein